MPTYRVEQLEEGNGWQFAGFATGENGPTAFRRFYEAEHLTAGDYRLDPGDLHITITEAGEEVRREPAD